MTKPEIDSNGISASCIVTFSSLKVVHAEKALTCTLLAEIGMNECSLRVPGIVRDT